MKKSFEYDLTKYSPDAPTRTEEFLTADGVKTLTTDANDGAVLIQDSVDKDSLNPVTAAAVSAAIEAGGGGGGSSYSAGDGISISEDTISAKVDGTTIGVNASGELEALGGGGTSYSAGAGIAINNDTISVNHDNSLTDAAGTLPVEISGMMNTFRILPNASLTMDDTLSISCSSTSWAGVGIGLTNVPGYMRVKLTSVADPSKYVISTINCRKNGDEIYLDSMWSPYGLGGVAFNTYENAPISYAFNWGSLTLDDIGLTTGSGAYVTLVMCDSNGDQLGNDLAISGLSSSDWTVGSSAAPQRLSVSNPVPSTSMVSSGSVLTVGSNFQPEWAAVPKELPASLGTAGQVLTVNSGATGVEWATPSGGGAGAYMVDFTNYSNWTSSDKDTYSAGIAAAAAAGQPVIGKVSPVNGSTIYTEHSYVYLQEWVYQDSTNYIFTFTVPYWKFDPSTSPYHWWGIRRVTWETSQGLEDVLMQLATGMPSSAYGGQGG